MRLLYIAITLLVFKSFIILSQPIPAHYNNWIFGQNAGITFSTADGNPNVLELMDKYSFIEGTSSISDDDGDLLYYLYLVNLQGSTYLKTSGLTQVKNGGGILTGSSSSNPGLFVQDFINSDLYYLITASETEKLGKNGGIHYSIIDRTKENGFGEVILKNKNLYENATEKITAVMNEVDNICWVITHEWYSDAFKIIRIDENGLDENLITQNIGFEHKSKSETGATGRMSMSPNGTTLAVTVPFYDSDLTGFYNGDVELFDFDPKTGLLSNARKLRLGENTYAVSFSPNGKVLYIKVTHRIYQYDLTICDIDEMIENRYAIETKPTAFYNAIERGPNGIIYCGRDKNTFLDAILNPNIIGEGCNYTEDLVDIGGEFIWGLPTVINSFFTGEYDDYCLVKDEEERNYKINAPKNACFGDDIFLQIESENGDEFEAEMIRPDYIKQYVTEPVGPSLSTDGKEAFTFKIVNPFNSWPRFNFRFRIVTENGDIDTVSVPIESANCCTPFIRNWQFNEWNTSNTCYPVGYMTEYFFSPDSNVSCIAEIRKPGELKSSSSANRNLNNFDKTPTTGRILVGDPLPNVEQRAWYQNYATKIGTRYRFMASVCNVEKIERKVDHGRSLDMWIGIKNRNQEFTLNRVDDIKYEDDWILLSGEFTAQDNYSEFQVWTLGNSVDNNISYGFAIDFVDLELVEDYELTVSEDTTICIYDEFTPNNKFNGNIVDVVWEPTGGLSDPNTLNPVISLDNSTKYIITLYDELGCEYVDSLYVEIDSCFDKCLPCVSYSFNDIEVNIGDTYCIGGTFVPSCPDSTSLRNLTLYFEYNPYLMNFVSSSAKSQIIENGTNNILKLDFDKDSVNLNVANELNICFTALLGIKDLAKLNVYEDDNTLLDVCVTNSDSAQIKYIACNFPLRRVKFLSETQFEAQIIENRIALILSTEEKGVFKFVLTDISGRVIKKESFDATANEYNKEEVVFFDLGNVSSGAYIVKMQTPSGRIISQKIIVAE